MSGKFRRYNNPWLLLGTLMYLSMLTHAGAMGRNQRFESLSALLYELNITHDATLESMISASQVWRRKPGQERWDLPALDIPERIEHKVFELLAQIGLTEPTAPGRKQYDYALLLGATVPGMKQRLDYLVDCWNQGVRFRHLIYLVGQRPLNPEIDYPQLLISQLQQSDNNKLDPYPFTETEAAIMLHQLVPMPVAMRAVPVEFIDTPRNWRNGFWHRPNTRDTLRHWAKIDPLPGTALVLSDQPHGMYQKEVVRQELTDFTIDLAAGPADPATTLPVYLDALALWLKNMELPGLREPVTQKD